ncbi:ABC transporter substrate-binding protein [Bradyrhizobium sp. 188]|uniref:ABC transporter substrate-binding protein n=1 Tax=Bradyrhizobium sp. 188 TaxID=2782656 RepID=UPI001FF96479|nr:ABC transporter substrate-binding protein [Bradyrhizobium sp. 188]MCK1496702.1 ABC transporter substrate-binding protein [Bradyrhizobium sp. 188]
MSMSRRELFKGGLLAGAALSMPAVLRAETTPAIAGMVRMVMSPALTVFDPVFSSSDAVINHAFAIYDTLFSLDSKLEPQSQMLEKWNVSDDKRTYTFELRDGLGWHDRTPVTAADCVASIRRWGQVTAGGQLIMARAKDISKKNDRTFIIALSEPLPILVDTLASMTWPLFIMREKDANRPASEQVTANIGSGPFKFNEALARPGSSFTYDRNKNYVPRKEALDGFAGGKIVKVERIVWDTMPDQQTAIAALQAGEIDFVQSPPIDLLPAIESDPNLALQLMNTGGTVWYLRLNFLQKPFNNVKARQAMLHLIDQEAFMRAAVGEPKYIDTVTSIFGKENLYSNDENTGWYKKGGDAEKAKQLFKEAGYAGEKVVILQPTDQRGSSNIAQLLALTLQKIGINAELAASDYGGMLRRQTNKGPVENGGWSIRIGSNANYSLGNPLTTLTLSAGGDKAWIGWPKSDEYEALRSQWADLDRVEERKALARKMQRVWWDFVGAVYLGQSLWPNARRKSLTGLVNGPTVYVAMWNTQKA